MSRNQYGRTRKAQPPPPPREETPEEQAEYGLYKGWHRFLKERPISGDVRVMRAFWYGALQVLGGERKDLQQYIPRDLASVNLFGHAHIDAILNLDVDKEASKTFLTLAKPFLKVFSHTAFLDCLAVDKFVSSLYEFFGGSDGLRAFSFFEQVLAALEVCHPQAQAAPSVQSNHNALLAVAVCFREVLRRQDGTRSHPSLLPLVSSLEETIGVLEVDILSPDYQILMDTLSEIRGMISRAQKVPTTGRVKLQPDLGLQAVEWFTDGNNFPSGIHDNDKRDITEITIIPTENEIRSTQEEFLPSTNFSRPHFLEDPVSRHLDTYFRLYRHDNQGELKENLASLISSVESNPSLLDSARLNLSNMRAFSFPEAFISDITFHDRRGLEALITFSQPPFAQNLASADRSKAWEDSKRLEQGVLLCLLWHNGQNCSILLFTVSTKLVGHKPGPGLVNLSSEPRTATIHATLATGSQSDSEKLVNLSCRKTRGFLVEFPGVIPATYVPVLENLQDMQKNCRLPFQRWILPTKSEEEHLEVPPPRYARKPKFAFSLRPIFKGQDGDEPDLMINPTELSDGRSLVDRIESQTTLDRGQCVGLLRALTCEYALIQGPPGTGKSYLGVNLMRVLLECANEANLGPIIVVCHTNHALDQFLEHLTSVGIKSIIRIGGRSTSLALEGKNLRDMSKKEVKTKTENAQIFQNKQRLEKGLELLQRKLKALKDIRTGPNFQELESHLTESYPEIHKQFYTDSVTGFQTAGRHPFDAWLSPHGLRREDLQLEDGEIEQEIDEVVQVATNNIQSVPVRNRRRLHIHWVSEIQNLLAIEIHEMSKSCEGYMQATRNVLDEASRRTLQTAAVIGVTTSGLATNIGILRHISSKVIICEEAGEIMEPHMISALLPSVEHVVAIGDHRQLRPSIQNFGLSMESDQGGLYQLDKSQFERLAEGKNGISQMPVAQLNVQRRMRPEVSRLIRNTIYPKLLNHSSVRNLPDVVGMKNNVFWLDHSIFEDRSNEEILQRERMEYWDKYNTELIDKSHKNSWEVDMVHGLVRHIVRQGVYDSEDIAVLTPYTGQLRALRMKFKQEFEVVLNDRDEDALLKEDDINDGKGVAKKNQPRTRAKALAQMIRMATIDNFQGEEAKVIIISLVRSNNNRQVGFLKTTNRINVLLSRAKHGMYLIGNTDTYSRVQMWTDVMEMLFDTGNVGEHFHLCCSRHPEKIMNASKPEDFMRLSPEGGCSEKCGKNLEGCGHVCEAPCHSDKMHEVADCSEPCSLTLKCGHQCRGFCGRVCPPCAVKVKGTLPCGHDSTQIECHQLKNPVAVKCDIHVQKEVAGCRHITTAPCHVNVRTQFYNCPEACGVALLCGHTCPEPCGNCRAIDEKGHRIFVHPSCRRQCDKKSTVCGHPCLKTCHAGIACCCVDCEIASEANRVLTLSSLGNAFNLWFEVGMVQIHEVIGMIKELEECYDFSRPELVMKARAQRSRVVDRGVMTELEDGIMIRPEIAKFLEEKMLDVRKTITDRQPLALPVPGADARLDLLGRVVYLKGSYVIISDRITVTQAFLESGNLELSALVGGGAGMDEMCTTFLQRCQETIYACHRQKLFRLSIQASLLFVKMTRVMEGYANSTNGEVAGLSGLRNEARDNLNRLVGVSELLFKDNDVFASAIKEAFDLLAAS